MDRKVKLVPPSYEDYEAWTLHILHTRPKDLLVTEPDIRLIVLNRAVPPEWVARFQDRLFKEGRYDPLTEISNYLGFMERAKRQITSSGRLGQPISLLGIDLDEFKSLNDRLGHEGANEVLRHVAEIMEHTLRFTDSIVARPHGDEFLVLLPNAKAEEARVVAERICQKLNINDLMLPGFQTAVSISASIGVACVWPPEEISPEECDALLTSLKVQADFKMFAAKEKGRNRTSG